MKSRSYLLSVILMAAVTPAFAQATSSTQGMRMAQNMQGMPMRQNDSKMKMMADCMQMNKDMQNGSMQDMPMGKMPCANETAQGTGVVEAIDTTKGTITIKHQAIASIHWPAMTMKFKAEPPSLLKDIKVGEKVNFTLHLAGMHGTVTAITPIR